MKRYLILGAGVVLLLAVILLLKDYLTVDKCLDAGGRWNQALKRCEFERSR